MNNELISYLDSQGCCLRVDASTVDASLSRMNVFPNSFFIEFYRRYEGPFSSEHTGIILSDLTVGGKSCIEAMTQSWRVRYGLGPQFLVLADLCGESITVYDWVEDKVFDADGEKLDAIIKGLPAPSNANKFSVFIEQYFLGDS